ncbi:MAG: sigma-54-dependent Fis family transcriptional regulator [Syntrophales bacterium]
MDEAYTARFGRIFSEWKRFIHSRPPMEQPKVSPMILKSWERCRSIGVDPYLMKVRKVLFDGELNRLIEGHAELISISIPFMEKLHELVRNSGFVVVVFNVDGYLLEIIGDEDVIRRVRRGNFVRGSCWSEEEAGTNGVGTVLEVGEPVQVYGCEHYCINSHKMTGSGAPIRDPEGRLIGGLAMTGHWERANPHTLGMVVAAAYAIENEMQVRKMLAAVELADGFRRTVIGSIPEAIITLDHNCNISLANKNACRIFGWDIDTIIGRNIQDVFGKQNENFYRLLRHNQTLTDAETRIFIPDGEVVDYTLTCNPIETAEGNNIGRLVILNEIRRARTLVTTMMGAKAKLTFADICGKNKTFLETVEAAKIVSRSTSNVLLLGQSGTGKDIFAQAIHNESRRRNGPYVAINCAAIPRDLISSELFGYSEGAFTGSRRGGNRGKFELADGGTIFLDEIAETPLEFQTALLRVIEDRSVMRIGGSRITPVDVRIIAATNKDLREEVRQGRFREDLYYRFNVFTIQMIPLKERPDDIPLLVDNFVKKISRRLGKLINRVDSRVLQVFANYSWPGNVRELQNVIERMANVATTDVLTADLIPQEILLTQKQQPLDREGTSLRDIEKQMFKKMIQSGMTKGEIAKHLGISRSTLYRKMEKFYLS